MSAAQEADYYKRLLPHLEQRAREVSPARLAGELFIKASGEYPAAAIAQAIRIQQLCRATGCSVGELGDALEHNQEELVRVAEIANNAHQHSIGNNDSSRAPAKIEAGSVLLVVQHVFLFARLMDLVSSAELDKVLSDFYPQFLQNKATRGTPTAEKILTAEILTYLKTKMGIAQLLLEGAKKQSTDQSPTE